MAKPGSATKQSIIGFILVTIVLFFFLHLVWNSPNKGGGYIARTFAPSSSSSSPAPIVVQYIEVPSEFPPNPGWRQYQIIVGDQSLGLVWRSDQPASSSISHTHSSVSSVGPGWKPFLLYVGEQSLGGDAKMRMGQAKQDDWVLAHPAAKEKSGLFFLDLASNHATVDSNTRALELNGWDGICVEANPKYWWDLAKRKCKNVAAVVSDRDNRAVSFEFLDGLGSVVEEQGQERHSSARPDSSHVNLGTIPFSTVSLKNVLDTVGAPRLIHFMSLDIEGSEWSAMRNFPFDQYQFWWITAERPSKQLHELFNAKGYRALKMFAHWGDTAYIHESNPDYEFDMKVTAKLSLHERFFGHCAPGGEWAYVCNEKCWEPPYCKK